MPVPMRGFRALEAGKKLLDELVDSSMIRAVAKKPGTANIPPETTPKAVGGWETKQSWEMNRNEFVDYVYYTKRTSDDLSYAASKVKRNPGESTGYSKAIDAERLKEIKKALSEGKTIPETVLQDFPPLNISKFQREAPVEKQYTITGESVVPGVVYHGSLSGKIKDFSESGRFSELGPAFFTNKKDLAEQYARAGQPTENLKLNYDAFGGKLKKGHATEATLDIKRPITEKTSLREILDGNIEFIKSDLPEGVSVDEYGSAKGLWDAIDSGKIKLNVRDNKIRPTDEQYKDYPVLSYVTHLLYDNPKDSIKRKYDGIIAPDSEIGGITYLPFKKEQIKTLPEPSRPPEVGGQLLNAIENSSAPTNLKTITPVLGTAAMLYPQESQAGPGTSLPEILARMGASAPVGANLASWRNPQAAQAQALQEPLVDPTYLLAGPARLGGGPVNIAFDSLMKLFMGQ